MDAEVVEVTPHLHTVVEADMLPVGAIVEVTVDVVGGTLRIKRRIG